jgi:hypothetical protein
MGQGAQHRSLCTSIAIVAFLAIIATGCSDAATVGGGASPAALPPFTATIPAVSLERMHEAEQTLTGEDATLDATNPQAMQTLLDGAGFVGARERIYTGGRGAVSRVALRAWQFSSAHGAGSFLDWLRVNATHEVIGEAKAVDGPTPVFFVHEPSGCCHEETPVYLSAWRHGDVVWTVQASGPRIQTPPVVALVHRFEQEV